MKKVSHNIESPMSTKASSSSSLSSIITLPVDYGMLLDQMIGAGRYDWVTPNLNNENFPVQGEGVCWFEFDLVNPKRTISSSDILSLLEKDSDPANPWIPAKIEHLLVFGAQFPELQLKNIILALGSVAKIDRCLQVACLSKWNSERRIYTFNSEGSWFSGSCFLRIRPVTAPMASATHV